MSKQCIKYHFDKKAYQYDDYSDVQQFSGEKLISLFVAYVNNGDTIMDLGCGTGFTTYNLSLINKNISLYAIDYSEQSLHEARKKLSTKVKLINADLNLMNFNNYNCTHLFANMSLQWLESFEFFIYKIYQALPQGGVIAFSIPLQNTFANIPTSLKNRFMTLDAVINYGHKANFKILANFTEIKSYTYSNVKTALLSIKAIGANSLLAPMARVNRLKDMKFLLTENGDMPFTLSYEIGFFMMQKQYA